MVEEVLYTLAPPSDITESMVSEFWTGLADISS